jgi:diamine N-acetyltransferase
MTELVLLTRANWENYISIKVHKTQASYVPSILYSLAQARFEPLTPFGINHQNNPVGFAMYGNFGKICWINRIIIDAAHQGKGLGSQALALLLTYIQTHHPNHEIRTSYSKANLYAQSLFDSAGFLPINDALPDEIVAIWEASTTPKPSW